MSPLQEAIVLLNIARDKIDTELWNRGAHYATTMSPDAQDLSDTMEDLGPILHTLESLLNPDVELRRNNAEVLRQIKAPKGNKS